MNDTDLDTARADLAFMRSLVDGGGRFQEKTGEVFLWAGLLYGLQCFGHLFQVAGVVPTTPALSMAIGFGPTAIFLILVAVLVWQDRKSPQDHGSTRAMNAVFQGAGLANLVMAFVFAYGAHKAESMAVWLYHPVVVCMFQGVAWFAAWRIRRRPWLGFVSLGWFAVTIACGVLIDRPGLFLLTLGSGLILFMALPGWTMIRLAKRQS